jgi:CO/xanthine dehydrogenase FAD-binding subunit
VTVLLPRDLAEALDMRARHPEATPIAGGTDLCVHWPQRVADEPRPRTWLDLSSVDEIRERRWTEDELVLGARATYWDVIQDRRAAEELPLLVDAARQVGAIQIQVRGTWGGNIVNASPAADGVPVLMAYDAVLVLRSSKQTVEIPLSEFYLGYKEMRIQPDQLLTEIRIPRGQYDFQWFEKVGSRSAQAITKVGVAVTRRGSEWRVVANSVAPTVCRCRAVESLLASGDTVSRPDDLLAALDDDVSPIDDVRSTARYRGQVLARLLYFGLRDECSSFT